MPTITRIWKVVLEKILRQSKEDSCERIKLTLEKDQAAIYSDGEFFYMMCTSPSFNDSPLTTQLLMTMFDLFGSDPVFREFVYEKATEKISDNCPLFDLSGNMQ